MKLSLSKLSALLILIALASCSINGSRDIAVIDLKLEKGQKIVLVGNTLGERMLYNGHFEALLHQTFPDHELVVRNLCWPADTPDLMPRSHGKDAGQDLIDQKPDILFAFFGYNESFDGPEGLDKFAKDLENYLKNPFQSADSKDLKKPEIILFSPIAFEDLSAQQPLPDGKEYNKNLRLYAERMQQVAKNLDIPFVDLFHPTQQLFQSEGSWTINGCHLNDRGYLKLGQIMHQSLFGKAVEPGERYEQIRAMVNEKSFQFMHAFRPVNGIHIYGERVEPFGSQNFPEELTKLSQMADNRDKRIWEISQGITTSMEIDDSNTLTLTPVETNFTRDIKYLNAKESLSKMKLPDGYKIELFASEEDFPELGNPVQMTFDNKGRLWVAVIPTYPHYYPGEHPNDKLIILEDTNKDGKADKLTVFADDLYLPMGFEFANGGVYVSQQPNLVFLKDRDGDDVADEKEIVLHGFSTHDAHHSISTFTLDPSGAIIMLEGMFLHTQVETPYGPVRGKEGLVYRFEPRTWKLEPLVRYYFTNPWGMAYDEYGAPFISDASNGDNYFMTPLMAKLPYGTQYKKTFQSFTKNNPMRPTSGSEFVSSRHFPDETQGDFLINNVIGFLGMRQFSLEEDGSGYKSNLRHDLAVSTDPNFRPVDMEFAPDGSLYLLDWHNALIGHMQHSVRDPKRDKSHGRIYRITYPSRPLVEPVAIHGSSVESLLANLDAPEFRTRYRIRRELRDRKQEEVMPAIQSWLKNTDPTSPNYERRLLEAMYVQLGFFEVDQDLLNKISQSTNPRIRAEAVRIARGNWVKIPNYLTLFQNSAIDNHPQVRLEALIASTFIPKDEGPQIAMEVAGRDKDYFVDYALNYSMIPLRAGAKNALDKNLSWATKNKAVLQEMIDLEDPSQAVAQDIYLAVNNIDLETWNLGKDVYFRDAHCSTCHQPNATGIEGIYPPLVGSEWVTGNPETLIKIILDGVEGDMTVKGVKYSGETTPPMTPFRGIIKDDKELAALLNYIRNNWGNKASAVSAETVTRVREETKGKKGYYTEKELLGKK